MNAATLIVTGVLESSICSYEAWIFLISSWICSLKSEACLRSFAISGFSEAFSSSFCNRSAISLDIPYTKRLIDVDPEAQADALMLNIVRVPAVVVGDTVIRVPIDRLVQALRA